VSKESRRRKIKWLEHVLWVLGTWTVLAIALAVIAVGSGLANPLLRRLLIEKLETLTGAQVEIRTVSVGWFSLNANVNGLTIHGTEPKDTEALLTLEQAKVGLRIDSFWGRRVSLKELVLLKPRVHIRVEKNGDNNLPTLKRKIQAKEPLQETLLNLHIGHLQIDEGWILYNNVRSQIAVEGGELKLEVNLRGTPESPLYLGGIGSSERYACSRESLCKVFTGQRGIQGRTGNTRYRTFSCRRASRDAQSGSASNHVSLPGVAGFAGYQGSIPDAGSASGKS
jgi:uncharacterized protein involved in outer membrane biogenesis